MEKISLDASITKLPKIGVSSARKLEKLGIFTVGDLLHHVPFKYLDLREVSPINKLQPGEYLTIRGELVDVKNTFTRYGKNFQTAKVKDSTGEVTVVWFNQPYLVKNFSEGEKYAFAGKVETFSRKTAMIAPEYEKYDSNGNGLHTGRLIPVYPSTYGISVKWLRSRIDEAYTLTKHAHEDYLPSSFLKDFDLPSLSSAIENVHYPKSPEDYSLARKRLALDELVELQLKSTYRKLKWKERKVVYCLKDNPKEVDIFINSLPFKLTPSQGRSIAEIKQDLSKTSPMNRLLEGDVGSGKTAVAAVAAYICFLNGYQTVFMAPTQILAQQHYQTLNKILSPFKVRLSLVTSQSVKKDPGKTDIFIGTHALIHKKVPFDKVALLVIDEQHRFGVEQRAHLAQLTGKKNKFPHTLTMTATPIPRTIALTVYGDLDLSTLDELPQGRQPITTWVVSNEKRKAAYKWIEQQVKKDKIQAFVVCPLIEESVKETMVSVKAATKEFENLKKAFPRIKLDLLHGRQKADQKNSVIEKFKGGKTDILVTTPVVEVGIDIPNATIMCIEGSDRFGLSQLHQLRGRVGRGKAKSYCLLFTDSKSPQVKTRLKAMQETISGFKLAELDLKLRGPGEIMGFRQSGFGELKIASWSDTDLIKTSKMIAEKLTKNSKYQRRVVQYYGLDKLAFN